MTNEQLLIEIGRVMANTVRNAIQESEDRMKLYVHDVVQASEERMKVEISGLCQQMQETDERLTSTIYNLRGTVQQSLDDTEKMARQLAATVARVDGFEVSCQAAVLR